ncbi:NUDIX domain-containing protein [Nitratifractor sp.]
MVTSAGILPYRIRDGKLELFLVHMGGPYWRNKERSWSIAKGELGEGEDPEKTARREFEEETGQTIEGDLHYLGEGRSGSKRLLIYAVEAPSLSTQIRSNTFRIEWPPKSGKTQEFPEVDRAAWMNLREARRFLVKSQLSFVDRLEDWLETKSR